MKEFVRFFLEGDVNVTVYGDHRLDVTEKLFSVGDVRNAPGCPWMQLHQELCQRSGTAPPLRYQSWSGGAWRAYASGLSCRRGGRQAYRAVSAWGPSRCPTPRSWATDRIPAPGRSVSLAPRR